MTLTLGPKPLSGCVEAPASKSEAQRHLICAALCEGQSALRRPALSEDIEATLRCLSALGASFSEEGDVLRISPIKRPPPHPKLDCGESGATLRFLLPVAAALGVEAQFTGRGRLPERPLAPLLLAMREHGSSPDAHTLPFTLTGRLRPGTFRLPGHVSSQFFTGLFLALPRLERESYILPQGPLHSAPYVALTLAVLQQYGIRVREEAEGFLLPGGQRFYAPEGVAAIGGDWSSAAPFLAAGALGSAVTVRGLDLPSLQADRAICGHLRRFGAEVREEQTQVRVLPGPLRGCTLDLSQSPDLLPVLAVVAACAVGESRFVNLGRLRGKESDRLASVARLLCALGAKAEAEPDGLLVRGCALRGGVAESASDHRIAMAAALAATVSAEPVTLRGADCVKKSYPAFFQDYRALGGIVDGV